MNAFGKTLLTGLAAGVIAALLGYGVTELFVKGDDPERIALSIMLVLTFLAGTVTCGIAAARFNRVSPFSTAVLAALAFEAILLIVARPGLSFRAITIALVVAMVFASIGAFIGLPRRGNA